MTRLQPPVPGMGGLSPIPHPVAPMNITAVLIRRFASLLKIPDESVNMLLAASDLSGLERASLPSELIPLNSTQISRGVLNYVVFQGLHGWVFPYSFVRQLNPDDLSFVPRAHLSVLMNVTHRNWTAIGNPESDIEPIVDPRGLVTFAPNGWSLDFWFRVDGNMVFPSRVEHVSQRLVEGDPIVETAVTLGHAEATLIAYTAGRSTYCRVDVDRQSAAPVAIDLIVAVRPFNPEGTSLIHTLLYDPVENALHVGHSGIVHFSQMPGQVLLSTLEGGDVAQLLQRNALHDDKTSVYCDVGLATGAAVFPMRGEDSKMSIVADFFPMKSTGREVESVASVRKRWEDYRRGAMTLSTPDPLWNELFRASLSTVIQLVDKSSIAPGPFTYHQFWFRDAAVMLASLDRTGFAHYASRVVSAFPRWQEHSGFYRSQQGEWDANGQALWSIGEHVLHAEDGEETFKKLLPSMRRGIAWIRRSRLKTDEVDQQVLTGLLPAGLSAEHLGLADYYYWDDFWALAGIRSFERMCKRYHHEHGSEEARLLAEQLQQDLERALQFSERVVGRKAMPAGPLRGLDSGMIGSIAALYPLQLLDPLGERASDSLEVIASRFLRDGMFFQDFVHSGLNTYLSMQLAHAYLYRWEREKFLEVFRRIVSRASSTYAYPEAIHPTTGGGIMGDGHHGWAAAEMVLNLREMFIYERWDPLSREHTVVMLAGIPAQWFERNAKFGVTDVPLTIGRISVSVAVKEGEIEVAIEARLNSSSHAERCMMRFPFGIAVLAMAGESGRRREQKIVEDQVAFELCDGRTSIAVRRSVH